MNRSILIFLFLLGFIINPGVSQSEIRSAKSTMISFAYGYGGENINVAHLDHHYEYEIHLIQIQWNRTILTRGKFDIDILITPQINTSRYRHNSLELEEYHGMEWGITAGFAPKIFVARRKLGMGLLLSSGPMYISGGPERQANGFNFGSNALMVLQIQISRGFYVKVNSGFRHLSNANLSEPNGGINSLVITGGIAMAY